MNKHLKEQQEKGIDHACRILILTKRIYEINLMLENYSQKTLLKFYNENLKNRNLTPSNISTMKKYLTQLKKEINVIIKFYFNDTQSIIYYKLNHTIEKVSLTLQEYCKLFYKRIEQFLQENTTT
ncbi:plasmid maintenance protein [Borreliella burgdorferi]|uniref:plasmid maintenance protein n=1 Tax=Borreliella burgdorferi TaxID=139 RepID=UPI001E5FF04B|nr:plasmid maintenance protein [Borreliella burgdorferi]MCD2420775.1 plasmid maintenance protein [Borreliella burgdorferi]